MKWFLNVMRQYRWQELRLMIIPIAILVMETIQLLLARQVHIGLVQSTAALSSKNFPTLQALTPILGFIVLFFIVNVILSARFRMADQILLPLVGLLSGFGVLMATRLGPSIGDSGLGGRQLLWVLIGFVVLLGTVFLLRDVTWLSRYKYIWALVGILLVGFAVISILHAGSGQGPAHDEICLRSQCIQPSEFLKICLVVFFAAYISENLEVLRSKYFRLRPLRLPPFAQLGPMGFMLVISLLLFWHELGLALLIYGVFLCMIYIATNKLSFVVVSVVLFALLGFLLFSRGYVQQRFATVFIDVTHWTSASEALYNNGGYQIVQGLITLSSGGIVGTGLGLGHPGFVPVVQSDMVFTALGEEFGLAGLFAILGIYLLLIYRGYRIAIEAGDTFNKLLAAGLTSIFAVQTFVIIAGNIKLFPLTGVPLPFVSAGGSSIMANYIIIGILLRISHNTDKERAGQV